jgi:hypothetical protein
MQMWILRPQKGVVKELPVERLVKKGDFRKLWEATEGCESWKRSRYSNWLYSTYHGNCTAH